MEWPGWCRDTDLMSRHGSGCLVAVGCHDQGFGLRQGRICGMRRGWSRHRFEVATWLIEIRCLDLGFRSRPRAGCLGVSRPAHAQQARVLAVRATWVLGVRTVHSTQF